MVALNYIDELYNEGELNMVKCAYGYRTYPNVSDTCDKFSVYNKLQ
jgi:hypothetical protein